MKRLTCAGCEETLSEADIALGYDVCLSCVRVRHYTSVKYNRTCHCGKKSRATEIKNMADRRWVGCERCLGVITQLS